MLGYTCLLTSLWRNNNKSQNLGVHHLISFSYIDKGPVRERLARTSPGSPASCYNTILKAQRFWYSLPYPALSPPSPQLFIHAEDSCLGPCKTEHLES